MSEEPMTGNLERVSASSGSVGTASKAEPVHDDAAGCEGTLLERMRGYWRMGDWENLSCLTIEELRVNPDRAELAMLVVAGRLQLNQFRDIQQFIQLAREWGASQKSICEILAAGVHNSLARVAAIDKQPARALKHFEIAIGAASNGNDVKLIAQTRLAEQLHRLSSRGEQKPAVAMQRAGQSETSNILVQIEAVLENTPDAPPLLIAAAEAAQRNGDLQSAIRYWQRLASVDGAEMSQLYYDRLAQAYKEIKSFPLGSAGDEALLGDTDKHQVLGRIHQILQPSNYLEIGVQTGKSIALAKCNAIGVDPAPTISVALPDRVKLIRATSDQFFAEQALNLLSEPVDMAFIDGMHLFEYALRDFINIEKYAGQHTLVVIDDILPVAPAQAARDRKTRAWTGDVWKLLPILRERRPDLSLLLLNAYPTGLVCISGLNSKSTALQKAYREIVSEWSNIVLVPDEILSRVGALPCEHSDLDMLIKRLRAMRTKR
ncbi:class I SAM-dependent methyltransferase [Paraburkholderia sp. BCC1886]|uniref:class I SAM-dependent methyltransferase n=1 Tax=Paraburkholderia sp. BCC1886 TaxID=2562670 RepID=UPI001182A65B|nr:class I SAM-dependent methyltransferase [Paraburkholderia sp. BCC1886]